MDWLHKISITCFAASYLIALVLEISRVAFKATFRKFLVLGIMVAGLFAHSVYWMLQSGWYPGSGGVRAGNLSGWCLGAAWFLAVATLWRLIRRPRSIGGLILLPITILLIFAGAAVETGSSLEGVPAKSIWSMVHGMSLLIGTSIVAIGFVFGVMYLLQARQLKKKTRPPEWFRLPSLEWLQTGSERSLIGSALMLGLGLASGLVINLLNNRAVVEGTDTAAQTVVPWDDPVVWSSGILFAWLLAAVVFSLFYKPARQGRKVAYLVVASFLFLVLELVIVFRAGHALPENPVARARQTVVAESAAQTGGSK